MARYFMKLAFRGVPFHGWQRQPGDSSVQAVVEDALAKVLRNSIPLTGAGRTDAGVNARMMIAHFDADEGLGNEPTLIRSLNSIVGRDIAIQTITGVHDDAHARFDADSRTYRYFASTAKSPFLYPLSWKASPKLDFDKMNQAAQRLLTTDDFASFAKAHSDAKTTLCKVTRACWIDCGNGVMAFEITADRFLRNMVRAVVGTLVEVGRGKLSLEDFYEVISAKDRCRAGTSMSPEALFLWRVTYPYYDSEKSIYKQNHIQ